MSNGDRTPRPSAGISRKLLLALPCVNVLLAVVLMIMCGNSAPMVFMILAPIVTILCVAGYQLTTATDRRCEGRLGAGGLRRRTGDSNRKSYREPAGAPGRWSKPTRTEGIGLED